MKIVTKTVSNFGWKLLYFIMWSIKLGQPLQVTNTEGQAGEGVVGNILKCGSQWHSEGLWIYPIVITTKAFDRVPGKVSWRALRKLRVDEWLVQVKVKYKGSSTSESKWHKSEDRTLYLFVLIFFLKAHSKVWTRQKILQWFLPIHLILTVYSSLSFSL